jgi:hypothetical protein
MSALFHFNEKLEATRKGGHGSIARQVEIFTRDGKLYLRIGPTSDDAKGEAAIDIELPKDAFIKFSEGLSGAGRRMGYMDSSRPK